MSSPDLSKTMAPRDMQRQSNGLRQKWNFAFVVICILSAAASLVILCVLLGTIAWQGSNVITGQFLTSPNSTNAAKAGVYPALMGSLYVCLGCALFSLPIGVGTAIFLEEFRPRTRVTRSALECRTPPKARRQDSQC